MSSTETYTTTRRGRHLGSIDIKSKPLTWVNFVTKNISWNTYQLNCQDCDVGNGQVVLKVDV